MHPGRELVEFMTWGRYGLQATQKGYELFLVVRVPRSRQDSEKRLVDEGEGLSES